MPWWSSGGGGASATVPVGPPIPPTPPVVVNTLDVVLPPSSFVSDTRSAYDGAIGGTASHTFIAIPGLGSVPDRVFWFSQSDGTAQRGVDPTDWYVQLVGYAAIEVPLPAGMVTAQDVALALQTAMSPFPEYTVTQIGSVPTASWQVRISGANIDAAGSFTGGDFASRGDAGLWGIRVAQVNTLPFGTFEGVAVDAYLVHGVSPANPVNRVLAMDIFVGSVHNGADQPRLVLFEGGTALSPVGATRIYDFGQISGTAVNGWIRTWVDPDDVATVGSGTNLWFGLKSAGGVTLVRNVQVGAGWQGNMTDQDFFITTMNPDATVAYPATVPAGGGFSGFNVILCLRIIYDSEPFAADGSWLRRFGSHLTNIAVGNEVAINSQLYMGATPPQVLGMELDYHDTPYGTVHVGQFRAGAWQGGVLFDPTGAPIADDFGQTSGVVVNGYARLFAPGPGPSAIAIDTTDPLWWGIKNNAVDAFVRFAFMANPEVSDPPENPQDWAATSEFEIFAPTVGMDPDPAVPYEATVPAGGLNPGNWPFAALGLRVNGISLVAS